MSRYRKKVRHHMRKDLLRGDFSSKLKSIRRLQRCTLSSKPADGNAQKARTDLCERLSVRSDQFCIHTSLKLTLMTLANLGPSILTVLTKMIAKLRWEETSYVPLSRVRFRLSKFADDMLI